MSIARSVLRVVVALVSAALFAALLSFAAVPDASAHHDDVGSDLSTVAGRECPPGTATGGSSFGFGGEADRCIFAPSSRITTEGQCTAAGGTWDDHLSPPVCVAFYIPIFLFDVLECPVGLRFYSAYTDDGETSNDGCIAPLRTRHTANFYKPICIEDSMLQGDEELARLRVNSEIQNDAGTTYFVQSGAGCTFDCADGFDVNCDGEFGDYCRVEIDRKSVAGAGQCIAESGPAVQPLPPVEATQVSTEAPTTLAHTGSEESIAMIGFWLVGAGATALMVRRRRNS